MSPLEARALLNGDLSGIWIGQDQHDFVGPSNVAAPDGVQDIHISLSGLAAGKTVASVDVQGLGGGEWKTPTGPGGPWAADLIRSTGSTSADLYLDPYQAETGRPFSISVTYTDGSNDATWIQGGAADPNLRMPAVALTISSVTQVSQDLTGLGPGVGPDGYQDLDVSLANLSPGMTITDAELDGPPGTSWAYGHNPDGLNNAELIANASDSTRADLFLQPNQDLFGKALTLTIDYANGKSDTASIIVSSHTNPTLAMPATAPLPTVVPGVTGTWLGQDGLDLMGEGDVHVHLTGVPAGKTVVAATLNDQVGSVWAYSSASAASYYTEAFDSTLGYKASDTDPTQADISFSPRLSEAGSTLTLRLQLSDGSIAVVPIAGGAADPGLKVAGPASTSIVARPGDDLNVLANAYGSVHLSSGEYDLSQPLVLNHPVSITADPGAVLMFSQASGATPWTAAVLVQASHTTLDGFAIRFAGPVVWNWDVDYGPAVVGSSDNLNPGTNDPKESETLTNLDIQAPPAASSWEQTPDLIRFVTAANGTIADNTLKGGTTEIYGGPWTITGNNYEGTVPDTYTPTAFAAHAAFDLNLSGNTAEPRGDSGKTYRFLTMNISGTGDRIADNKVIGIGPMDSDTEPNGNSPEIILTESYSVHFEGTPSAISSDGRILQIPAPPGGEARSGDVVSILTGPDAGQYRTIAQAIDGQTYLMSSPLPGGSYAISISTGFVGETYSGNTVDARGSSSAVDLDLQGNQFGATIAGNTLLGGNAAFLLDAAPTEYPNGFGWTHAPFLGATISGNTIGDSIRGGLIAVTGGTTIKETSGRVYVSGSISDNTFTFSDSFLASHPAVALTVGDDFSIDPGEIVLSESGDQIGASASQDLGNPVTYTSATINGVADVDVATTFPRALPAAPANFRLVTDTGSSSTDGITRIDDLRFDAVAGAAGYEYAVGSSTTFVPVSNPADFVPVGLSQGSDTISVRAYDSGGNRGPASTVTIVYDTLAPTAIAPALAASSDSGSSSTDRITNVKLPTFTATGDPTDLISLLRNGVAVATRTGPGTITEPKALADGTYSYSLLRIDLAGNSSTSKPISLTIDSTPPVATPPALAAGNDTGRSATDRITNIAAPTFSVTGDPTDRITLLRNGVVVASRTGPGSLAEPKAVADGIYSYSLTRTDLAGNTSNSPAIAVTIDTKAPITNAPILLQTSDSGRSASDGITSVKSPTFNVAADPTDLINLLRNGVSVASRIGPGTIQDPTGPADGTYSYSVKRTDVAGNASTSKATALVIDTTAPPEVTGLAVSSSYSVSFKATSATDWYAYRVGTTGAYTSIGPATSFVPAGLVPGLNAVEIHAIDASGNVGPDAVVLVNTAPTVASGTWLGQDGHDYVGQSWNPGPDGIQDIHIALAGLRAGHAIDFLDVRPLGGGEWQYPSTPGGPFAAGLIQTKGATTADLYIAPYQIETGRPYSIVIQYDDGVQAAFWVNGGSADPALKMALVASPAGTISAETISAPSTPAPSSAVATSTAGSTPSAGSSTATVSTLGNAAAIAKFRVIPTSVTPAGKHPLQAAKAHKLVVGLGWRRAALVAHGKGRRG